MPLRVTIRDFDHARHLVAIGQVEALDAETAQEAIYLQAAFEARLAELGDCTTTQAIDEGKWLCAELETLNAEWGEPHSPECDWHLY